MIPMDPNLTRTKRKIRKREEGERRGRRTGMREGRVGFVNVFVHRATTLKALLLVYITITSERYSTL